jgi:hypothetical protein
MAFISLESLQTTYSAGNINKLIQQRSTVVQEIKSKRKKVVGNTARSIDLNTTEQRDLSLASNLRAALGNDLLHKIVLGIEHGKREFDHWISRSLDSPAMGEQHVTDKGLLSVKWTTRRSSSLDASIHNAVDVTTSRNGAATTGSTLSSASAVDSTNLAVGVNSNVRTIDNQTTSTIGNVVGHGSKTSDSTERKARQTTHGKVRTKGGCKSLLQRTIDFVATEGCGDERRVSVSVLGQRALDHFDKLSVGLRFWEFLFDRFNSRLNEGHGMT